MPEAEKPFDIEHNPPRLMEEQRNLGRFGLYGASVATHSREIPNLDGWMDGHDRPEHANWPGGQEEFAARQRAAATREFAAGYSGLT